MKILELIAIYYPAVVIIFFIYLLRRWGIIPKIIGTIRFNIVFNKAMKRIEAVIHKANNVQELKEIGISLLMFYAMTLTLKQRNKLNALYKLLNEKFKEMK
jgi:hypothetical protein